MNPCNRPMIALLLIFGLALLMAEGGSPRNVYQSSPASSFYGVLTSNALPSGLFPKGISNFSIDPSSGLFRVHLPSAYPCDAKFETRVRYECEITGNLSYGRIANLSGVAAQELFLWLPVKGIQVDIPSSGLIYFDVGVVSKQFSLSFFETPKDCDALENGNGGDGEEVVLLYENHVRVVENESEVLVSTHLTDAGQRAVA